MSTGVFSLEKTLEFFLDVLLAKLEDVTIKLVVGGSESCERDEFEYASIIVPELKKSYYGFFYHWRIDQVKEKEASNILERLLNEFRDKFKEQIDEIRELHKSIKENKEFILKELKKLKEMKIIPGECEFVK